MSNIDQTGITSAEAKEKTMTEPYRATKCPVCDVASTHAQFCPQGPPTPSVAVRLAEYLKGYQRTDGTDMAICVLLEQEVEIARLRGALLLLRGRLLLANSRAVTADIDALLLG